MVLVAEARERYLNFFKSGQRRHVIIPSASLVPENDPTTLFTGSGMQPLLPYLLGESHPAGARLANTQKCFRSEDIEEIGDNRHTTFFEMLGNWSLGDSHTGVPSGYWKTEQLEWLFEFLTKEINLPVERLAVTCFAGDSRWGLKRDEEAAKIWEKLGIPKHRIYFSGTRKNWWSRSGPPESMPVGEPGGGDSEVFYEFTNVPHNPKFGEVCHPNCDCGRFMEIGNSVFMEYRKTESGFDRLPRRNVDFGGGLERLTAAANDEPDIFKIDVFGGAVKELERVTGQLYADRQRSFRVVLDHLRAAIFLISDGVTPANVGQGYFVRRLLRRASYHLSKLKANASLSFLIKPFIESYGRYYQNLKVKLPIVESSINEEEKRFAETIHAGLRVFDKLAGKGKTFSGQDAFTLFSTYGLPLELIREIARERGLSLAEADLAAAIENHQKISRVGASKKFKGGLADTDQMSIRYHTATHLLHQALRDVLGTTVRQKGSNITPERLRFDFAFPRKMTDDEKRAVEKKVNDKIQAGLPVRKISLPLAEAKASGALHFFDERYPDEVLIHYIGDSLQDAYSKEFCGGPHVANTREIGGVFKIVKEEAVSAGVRRIRAILEPLA
jgi:alanyl-tRNA synthetase